MPAYDIFCPNCGECEIIARMSEASTLMPCPVCHRPRRQIVRAPNFTEDRTRFFRGPLGNGYSFALGEQMPHSRKERDALAKKKGVEFVGKSEFLADNKQAQEAVEYRAHVDEGGAREDTGFNPAADTWKQKPEWAEGLTK